MTTESAKQGKTHARNSSPEAMQDQNGASAEPTIASKRTSSIVAKHDTTTVVSITTPVIPSVADTVRQYRSMLDVEEPPKLNPLNPMSFDELYTPPSQQPPKSASEKPLYESTANGACGTLANTADSQVKDLSC